MTPSSNGDPVRVLFPYVGGKKRWLPKWLPLFPPHRVYVSVFGGTGADVLSKPCSTIEILNDVDGDITNLYRVMRRREAELVRLVERTLARSRETYCEAVKCLTDPESGNLERAWAFLVITHQGYRITHPRLQSDPNFAGLRADSRCMSQWLTLPQTIEAVCGRLRTVQLEQLDFRDLISKYDGTETLLFVDPPYHPVTRKAGCYVHELTEQHHADLLELLNEVRAKDFLCGYDNELYRSRLHHWRRREFTTTSPHARRTSRTEVVWMNYFGADE